MRQVIGGDEKFEGGYFVTPECDRKQQLLQLIGAFRTMIRLWDISYHKLCGVFNEKKITHRCNHARFEPKLICRKQT